MVAVKDQKEGQASLPDKYDLQQGEQVLWTHTIRKSLFHREIVEEWIITNLRVIKRFPASKGNLEPRVCWVGLAAGDSVVMNERRQTAGNRVGNFVGVADGGFEGVTMGSSRSTSMTIGDLVFFVQGREQLRFQGVSDPYGVRRMIETVKKEIRKA